ncbi:MAG: D-alanyl-D-alanine carboxypeptidase, partial [Pseudanabaenaceae cyanobacterium bins.68]|nr:D-alanyl-D-alanine carboxypeptidase [Pseudanabaenaceae cyanobacterium bins.68]
LELELKRQGIWLESELAPQPEPNSKHPPEQILAVVYSPRLKELVSTTNKDSENLYAENLRLILGNQPAQLWSKWQIEKQDLRLVDGSGLARRNSLKPRSVVQLLQAMAHNSSFRNSLAIAGQDGTLKSRLAGTQIIAKTGTLDGIAALAGYILGAPELAFAVIINHGAPQPRHNRQVLDAIALELSRSCNLP